MLYKLSEIGSAIGAKIAGDPELIIDNLATIESATTGQLSYIISPKYRKQAEDSKASALIAYPQYKDHSKSLLYMENPYLGFAKAMRLFYRLFPEYPAGVEKSAKIGENVKLAEGCYIGHNAVIESGVEIGENTKILAGSFIGQRSSIGTNSYIFQNVTIREGSRIGKSVVIYSNAVIGSDGFGYVRDGEGHLKIPQTGIVVIEDNVEIGAGTTIDRATIGETFIGKHTIIDNLVQIAHNCRIGEGSVICAQVGLAGSTILGKKVTLAGQVGAAGHMVIGDGTVIEAQSGVRGDVPPNSVYFGYPARDIREAHKIQAIIGRLPEYIKRLRKLEGETKD